MQEKYSGAVTLGYAALFISIWLSYMPFAGWFSLDSLNASLPFVMILGVILVISGIFCFFNEAKVESVLFSIIGAVSFSFSLRFILFPNLQANTGYSGFDGWMLILVAVVVFYLWMASKDASVAKRSFLLLLGLTLVAAALANWLSLDVFSYISGYLGLVAALLAGWYSTVTILQSRKGVSESIS